LLQGNVHEGDVLVIAQQSQPGATGGNRPPGFGGGGFGPR